MYECHLIANQIKIEGGIIVGFRHAVKSKNAIFQDEITLSDQFMNWKFRRKCYSKTIAISDNLTKPNGI